MRIERLWPSLLIRSLAIQGSWNYRTMLGGGFAFCLLPLFRRLEEGGEGGANECLRRHVEHFNSHPYLAGLAVGAVARMEAEGASPEEVRRFKTAIRGPLGSMGDRFVWAAWLPATVLGAAALALLGAPWWVVLVVFLVVYNVVHLGLRGWALRVGLRDGPRVAETLRRADMAGTGERIASIGVLLLGVVIGLLVSLGVRLGPPVAMWSSIPVGGLLFMAGVRRGRELWPWAVGGLLLLVFLLTTFGIVR